MQLRQYGGLNEMTLIALGISILGSPLVVMFGVLRRFGLVEEIVLLGAGTDSIKTPIISSSIFAIHFHCD